MGRAGRWAAVLVLLLGVGVGIGAGPASAHSNKSIVRLAITSDRGTTMVRAFLVYTNDHQPVTDELVLAEVSNGGGSRSFQLRSDRVPGYFASPVHLTAGRWTLRVSAKAATVGSATGALTVGDAGQLTAVSLSSSFDPSTVNIRGGNRSSSLSRVGLLVGGCVCLLLLIALLSRVRASSRGARELGLDAPEPGLVR